LQGAAGLAALAGAALLPFQADAQAQTIHTGGEKGSYYQSFGPLLADILKKNLFNYELATSAGSGDNLTKVGAAPRDIGLVQTDVMAYELSRNPAAAEGVTVIRNDVASECVLAVTSKELADRLQNWGGVRGVARRIRIATGPETSGAAITLKYLQSFDTDLAAATVMHQASVDAAIDAVASNQAHLALFVQFPDTANERFKNINKRKLVFLPVADRAMLRQSVGGHPVYQMQEVKVSSATLTNWGGVTKIVTACTPISYITGNPERLAAGSNPRIDHEEMIAIVRKTETDSLRPREGWFRAMIDNAAVMSGAGVEQLLKAADDAGNAVSKAAATITLPELPPMPKLPGMGQ